MNRLTRSLSQSTTGRGSLLLLVGWLAVVGAVAGLLAHSQGQSRQGLDERFDARAEIASRFVDTYVADLVTRQRETARRRFTASQVGERRFQQTVTDAALGAAVLLDGKGRLLRVNPPAPQLLGTDLTAKYEHLRKATRGELAVSKVVPSAARGVPVVAFAVPFATPQGRRVYSGAYDVARTPLGSYLKNAIPISPNRVYLIDPSGQVIAKNGRALREVQNLTGIDPALAQALRGAQEGGFETPSGTQRFASRDVPGTPWRIAISVPTERLYSSLGGSSRWLPWLAVAGFALGGLLVVALLSRFLLSRARLGEANAALDRLSRVDALTGLHNRRHAQELLEGLVSAARRHDMSLAVLVIDIDHFKQINDTYGHQAGDEVLCATATTIQSMLRTEDGVGRWGGEEFLVALAGADGDGAGAVAARVLEGVRAARVLADGETVGVTVTIGVAEWAGDSVDELVGRADGALYAGKATGRDTVVFAAPPAPAAARRRGEPAPPTRA